jgi:NADPH-dependent ferric siderophore reductase
MHETKRRHLTVLRTELIAPRMQRITLGGADLEGFTSLAPGDHVKAFFPDPTVGEIVTPVVVDGRPQLPTGPGEVIARDYTPAAFRPIGEHGPELDLDFVLHADGSHAGPAASWAAQAKPGDPLIIGGPRGSRVPPSDIRRAILIADESALPAVTRWLDLLGEAEVIGLFSALEPGTSQYLSGYEASAREFRWFSGEDRNTRIAETLAGLAITESTLVFLAGEAGSLIPLRRHLRRELGLPKEQVDAHGYWKQGEANLDHHAPLDPSGPD